MCFHGNFGDVFSKFKATLSEEKYYFKSELNFIVSSAEEQGFKHAVSPLNRTNFVLFTKEANR